MNDPLSPLPSGSGPLYRTVKRLITAGLASGEWQPGAMLPSEHRLAARYGVSIGTLRKAVDELVADQMLVRQQGRGTFVATHGPEKLLFHFFHIVPTGGGRVLPDAEFKSFARIRADATTARELRVAQGEPLFRIVNLLKVGAEPVVVDEIRVAAARFPGLSERVMRNRDSTIYALYQTRYAVNVVRTTERLRALPAPGRVARLLGIKPGAPLLEIRRIALSYEDAPVELRTSLVNTERHEYLADSRRPSSI